MSQQRKHVLALVPSIVYLSSPLVPPHFWSLSPHRRHKEGWGGSRGGVGSARVRGQNHGPLSPPRRASPAGPVPGVPRGRRRGREAGRSGRRRIRRRRRRRSAAPGGGSSALSPETGPAGSERRRPPGRGERGEKVAPAGALGSPLRVAPIGTHPSAAPRPPQPQRSQRPAGDGARRPDSRRPGASSRRPAPGGEGSPRPAQLSASAARSRSTIKILKVINFLMVVVSHGVR